MTHFRLITVEAFGDSHTTLHDTLDSAALALRRRDSGSIVYAHVSEIDAPKGRVGRILDMTVFKSNKEY